MWRWLRHTLRALSDHAGMDRVLEADLHFHLEMVAQKYVAQGLPPDEARRQALRNFGPMVKHREEARDARAGRAE